MPNDPFVMVPKWAIDKLGYGDNLLELIRVLNEHNYRSEKISLSLRSMMLRTGWGHNRCRRILDIARSCLEAPPAPPAAHLRHTSGTPAGTPQPSTDADSQTPPAPPAAHLRHTSGTPAGTIPFQEDIKKKDKLPPFIPPPWISQDAWNGYVEMRKRIRKPMTQRAMELAVAKLDRLRAQGQDPNEVLNQSTFSSWQGLFEVKAESGSNPSRGNRHGHYADRME